MQIKRLKSISVLLLAAALCLSACGAASHTLEAPPTPTPASSSDIVSAVPTESVIQDDLTGQTDVAAQPPKLEKAEYLNYKFAYTISDNWLGDALANTVDNECLETYSSDSGEENTAELCWNWVYDGAVPGTYSNGAVFLVWSADICGLVDAGTFLRSTDLREIFRHLTEVNGFAAEPLTNSTQFGGSKYNVQRGDVLFWLDGDGAVVNTGVVTLAQGSRTTVATCNAESCVASFALDADMKDEAIIKNCTLVHMSYPYNEQLVFLFLVNEMGYSNAAACGALANIYCESFFEPNVEEHNYSEGYGICQWTGARRVALEMWCSGQGLDYSRLSSQLLFMQHELENATLGNLDWTMRAFGNTKEDAYKAGYTWCELFENPRGGTDISKQRGEFARDGFFGAYSGHPYF